MKLIIDFFKRLFKKKKSGFEKKTTHKEMTYIEFRNEIYDAIRNKPKTWRIGQFVFNYIDEHYGVARKIQFVDKVDCYYRDDLVNTFIEWAYNEILKKKQ